MSDFVDEETNPDARVPLHPTVVEWAGNMAKAARHYKMGDDVIADFDRLLDLSRGGSR